jgi:hypothetical protein
MSAADISPQLPPLASVAAALRLTTEHLASELAEPKATAPGWSEFEWAAARAVSAMHGISGVLAEKLLWDGPQEWSAFLRGQREHIARRELRLQSLLAAVADHCQHAGIPIQALKGAALHCEGLYGAAQRPMADLDLLAAPRYTVRVTKVLEALGLQESHRTFKHRVFGPRHPTPPRVFGEHADNDLKVELHERICEPLPQRLTDISHWVLPKEAAPGLNPYPSKAALMAHLLLHAGGGMAYRTLRLIHLHDIALLARRLSPGDWRQLLQWRPWWAWPPLILAERYYGPLAPEEVMAPLRAFCQPVLRRTCLRQRITDVSLSRLWLEALPGIEWSRSFGDAATFIVRRIVPDAEIRSDRKFAVATDPSLAQGDWGSLPQGRRILRALRARTPRPWPLHNVRAALAESHSAPLRA